jgi:hypothetical protein
MASWSRCGGRKVGVKRKQAAFAERRRSELVRDADDEQSWLVGRPEARDRCPTLEKLAVVYSTPGYIWVGQLVEAVVGLKLRWWGIGGGECEGNRREPRQL